MKIGLVVAIETDSIFEYYKDIKKLDSPKGYNVFLTEKSGNQIYIIHTGMGVIASSGGVQYLITKYGVEIIVNFGVVGGLTLDMKKQKTCIVKQVVHYKYDCSEFLDLKEGQVEGHNSIYLPTDKNFLKSALETRPDLFVATCCSGDKFVGTSEEKSLLHDKFSGDICDMESAGIVLTCEANATPCLLLKAVSDGLTGGAKEFFEELKDASFDCLKITDEIISKLNK